MIALLLAGGKGTRLGETGRFFPKPLIPLVGEPIINHIVDKLLAIREISTIYVLTKKKQKIEEGNRDLDLETAFDNWKHVWYEGNDKVVIKYEEDLRSPDILLPGPGAIAGVHRFLLWFSRRKAPRPSHVLIAAADNYFEDDLKAFFQESGKYPRAIINGFYDFHDRERVRKKYGCITLDPNCWAMDYEEKPSDPSPGHTKASTALYLYPWPEIRSLDEYMAAAGRKTDAPGNLLEWFIRVRHGFNARDAMNNRNRGFGVRGYQLQGEWFDIGLRSDLSAAIKFYIDRHLRRTETVDDLVLADRTNELSDKYYFLCHRLQIDVAKRKIKIHFENRDKLCRLDANLPGEIPTIQQIRNDARTSIDWPGITRAIDGKKSFSPRRGKLQHPLLLSGGVFLFDSNNPGGGRLHGLRTLIPFLERGLSTIFDPARLTTPAGRMDMLDLQRVCYQEMMEEMIFYSADRRTGALKLKCVAPANFYLAGKRLLQRILTKRLNIPGLITDQLRDELRLDDNQMTLVERVLPTPIILPKEWGWNVEIYLDQDLHSVCPDAFVFCDQENATLEFRVAAFADITEHVGNTQPDLDSIGKKIGNLLGIADGEGYNQRPFLISALELKNYYKYIKGLPKADDFRDLLLKSQLCSANVLATGRAADGRFEKFNVKMPVLAVTSSVRCLMDLLEVII
jgi:NDP-sugar pyrophosphorylase family protein